ncbi:MAG TPA: Rieske 2Fe-2S domain-containing protein [Candidatus Baltobacteraceae bacterium]|nr:Rieske 2Fe-2S domain-containing protein [Candidatus Baltobacteraceae bacterium]
MRIAYLGHAGFDVETSSALLLMDPWLSPTGAFDGAWFQYPCNHDLADGVRARLRGFPGRKLIYLSHEHQDHLDREFLSSLAGTDAELIVPRYQNDRMLRKLAGLQFTAIHVLESGQRLDFGDGACTVYVDDTELNRDSAIFVETADASFFNMNDCKLFDALAAVLAAHGSPDLFTCQYSGAIWHPICYDYEPERYAAISKKKYLAKFEAVARAIETLRPKMYVPSAGPPCFLDPELQHLNAEPVSIFPDAQRILDYLEKRLQKNPVPAAYFAPGDRIEIMGHHVRLTSQTPPVAAQERPGYLLAYAQRIGPIVPQERHADARDVFSRLQAELQAKLDLFTFASRIDVPLFVQLAELPGRALKVDFTSGRVGDVTEIPNEGYYALTAPAWEIRRVLDRALTWDEFGLTFRVRLRRNPDVYQQFLYAFLILEIETVELYCARMTALENNRERIVVRAGGKEYSILRYCPHMGADLTSAYLDEAGLLTCPRHRWKYDLANGGECLTSAASVCAEELSATAAS